MAESFDEKQLDDCLASPDRCIGNWGVALSMNWWLENQASEKAPKSLSQLENKVTSYLTPGKKTSQTARSLNLISSTIGTVKSTKFSKIDVDNIIDLERALMLQTLSPLENFRRIRISGSLIEL